MAWASACALGALDRVRRQEVQVSCPVQVIKDGQRLRQPDPVNVKHWNKALRIAGKVGIGPLRARNQINGDPVIGDIGQVQCDADAIAGRRPPVIVKNHVARWAGLGVWLHSPVSAAALIA